MLDHLRAIAGGVAWVAPGNLHLTLKFLGQVGEERIDPIVDALTRAVSNSKDFEARVQGLGAFPSLTRPRVVWAGVTQGADPMVDLATRVDAALVALGFAREGRPFSPHVTLGRVRLPRRNPALADALQAAADRDFGRMRVRGASLMRSELAPKGARYTELAALKLGRSIEPSV